MSFNEQCPTQYIGPAEGVTVTNNLGVPVRLTKERYFWMTEHGALTDEQMLNAKWDDGRSLQDLLNEANGVSVITIDQMDAGVDPVYGDLFHRPGCSIQRNDRCICDYLAQWDKYPEYTAPTFNAGPLLTAEFFTSPGETVFALTPVDGTLGETVRHPMLDQGHTFTLSGKPLTTEKDIMAELDQLRTEMTMEDAAEISRRGTRERCTAHPHSWHFTDAMTCEQLNEQLLGVDGFSELTLHPSSMVRLAAETSNRLVKAAQKDTADEKLRTKYWHGEYKDIRRRFIAMFGIALAGWAFSIARGVWGF